MIPNMLLEADDKQLITITPEWMKEKFNEMNNLLFNGALKPCRFSLFTSGKGSRGGTLGWFRIHKEPGVIFKKMYYGLQAYYRDNWDEFVIQEDDFNYYLNPEIQLNGNYRWTEKAALSTLVHEMCHYYVHRDGFWPKQSHGPEFMSVARMVSAKSNEFFTVERLARAEQMEQMDFTDDMKDFNNRRAAKGIKYFKMELKEPEYGRGGVYYFAYAIPAQTIANEYSAYIKSPNGSRHFKRVIECMTTDGQIKRYHTVKTVGRWYYSTAKSMEELMSDVKADSETEVQIGEASQMEKAYTVFKMKYANPYKQGGKVYPWAYWIVKPNDFYIFRNYIMNRKNEFSYAEYSEVTDTGILSHKASNPKQPSINYLSSTGDVLPYVKKGEPVVLFGDSNTNNVVGTTSLGTFLYGSPNANPHLVYQQQKQAAQPEKRYTFSFQTMKNGMPNGTFSVTNATEAEAKQQMRQRFPGWSEDVINAKFDRYAKQQSSIALQEGDLRYMIEQVFEQLAQNNGAI